MSHPTSTVQRSSLAKLVIAALVGSAAVAVGAAAPAHAAEATITIDSDGDRGTPQHYASGFLYGLTEDGQSPSKDLLRQIGFNYNRAGGAQLDQNGGWRGGTYERRFRATLNQYRTVKELGGNFVILPHDLYGIDGIGGVGATVPGNGGDWADYDRFLERLISDVKSNGMTVEWDIWNEPDYPIFWPEPRTNQTRFEQYLELWRRTYVKIKAEIPDAIIVGPSTNESPDERDAWWRGYLDFVKANNVVPDIISWHEIEGRYNGQDPDQSKRSVQSMLAARGITGVRTFQVNEYAAPHQQYPAMSAWYAARFERAEIHGLRSHWGSAQNLHNDAAQLLYHEGTQYYTRGEYQTYVKYASQDGTVVPVQTTTRNVDAYATRSDDDATLTALIGSYNTQGAIDVVAEQGGPIQPGAQVRVIVEKVVEGNGRENRGATFVSDARATVPASGRLTTTVNLATSRDAYFVTIKSLDETAALDGRLTFGENLNSIRAGAPATVDTIYSNTGEQAQTGVTVDLVLPEGWTADRTTQSIGSVAAGERRTVSWQITAPASEVSKQRVIEAKARWQQAGTTLESNVWSSYSVPCTVDFTCESEEGLFTGGFFEANHAGYTGRGFIGGILGQGARSPLPFAIDAAGSYTARIRYAAGPDGPNAQTDRTMTVTAGGQSQQVTFPKTATWATWNTVDVAVQLPLGTSDVVIGSNAGDTAWVNLDSVTIQRAQGAVTVTPAVSSDSGATAAGWHRSPVSVAFTTNAQDAQAEYRIGADGQWKPATTAAVISTDGVTALSYRATRSGVAVPGTEGQLQVKLDRTLPVTTATTNPASGTVNTGGTVTATFSASDAGSGVDRTEYSVDAGATWVATTPAGVSFTAAGSHPVQYRSVDKAGNVEAVKQIVLTVTDPGGGATVAITSSDAPSADGWYQQSVLVKLTAPGASTKVQYRINGGAWKSYTSSITVSANGTTKVDHRLLSSNVVVAGSEAQTIVKIDKQLPAVTATRTPVSGTGSPRNPIDVSFTATDTHSGVSAVVYRVNSGAWTVATGEPLMLKNVGDYVVTYLAADNAGNTSTTKSLTVTIKDDMPTTIKASAKTLKPGAAVTLTLSGFARWDDVAIAFGATPLGTVLTDQDGGARVTIRVPANAANGAVDVTAVGEDGTTGTVSLIVKK